MLPSMHEGIDESNQPNEILFLKLHDDAILVVGDLGALESHLGERLELRRRLRTWGRLLLLLLLL